MFIFTFFTRHDVQLKSLRSVIFIFCLLVAWNHNPHPLLSYSALLTFLFFTVREHARDRNSAPRLKSCTSTMRQAARVSQRGRFPTPGSPGAIRLRNRKYKLSEGGVKGRGVVGEKKPQITSPPVCPPCGLSHRHSRASESKMAITSSFLPSTSCCYAVKVKDSMSRRVVVGPSEDPLSVNTQ